MTREIKIKPVLNGWVVEVGCQSVVFNIQGQLLDELDKYLKAPEETEKKYLVEAVNRMEPACPPPPHSQVDSGCQVKESIGERLRSESPRLR